MHKRIAALEAIQTPRDKRRFGVIVFLMILPFYLYGAVVQSQVVNVTPSNGDQRAYMDYAAGIATEGQSFLGDRNRMPLYPTLQSAHFDPTHTQMDFFERGKYLNVALSAVLLAMVWGIYLRYFTPLVALHFLLMTTFSLFVFKASYFQTELLFYTLMLITFVLLYHLFRRPQWGLAVASGVGFGLAHLSKASVLIGVGVFVVAFGLEGLRRVYQTRQWRLFPIASWALVVIFFLGVIFPYISTSKRVYGDYFYNVNTTFYVWYDSWSEATHGTKKYGDRVSYPQMPKEEIPSMQKYIREHSLPQMMDRLVTGYIGSLNRHCGLRGYGYCKYFVAYGISGLWLWWSAKPIQRREWWQKLRAQWPWGLFCLGYFGAYLVAYSWYAAIVAGPRFMLALFLPMVFVIGMIFSAPEVQALSAKTASTDQPPTSKIHKLLWVTLPLVIFDACVVLGITIRHIGGGA